MQYQTYYVQMVKDKDKKRNMKYEKNERNRKGGSHNVYIQSKEISSVH